jgi:aminoglycoside 3-N-acetyltransferase
MKLKKASLVAKVQLLRDLEDMGVCRGDHLAVTLSFKSVGMVEGGPEGFIDVLLDAVGTEGTIMMNTFTQNFPITAIPTRFVFEYKKTRPYTGIIPSLFLRRREARRSRHPTYSVAAIGRMADYLTESHDENANTFLPFEKLAEINGKYLCIGIDNRLVGIRHEVQRRAGLFLIPKIMGVLYIDSENKTKLFHFLHPTCAQNTAVLVSGLEAKGIVRRGRIGEASSLVANANDLMREMCFLLRQDPRLSLCKNVLCWECREMERRLGVHRDINVPKLFQESLAFRRLLDFRGKAVLRQYDCHYFLALSGTGRTWQNLQYAFFGEFLYLASLVSVSRFFEAVRNPKKMLRFLFSRT